MEESIQSNVQGDKKLTISKMTTAQDERKSLLYKKLIDNDIEGLRGLELKSLDLNVFEPVEDLAFVDESVSPLIYCAYFGKTEIAKLLLKHPMIDIDLHTPNNKQSPLIVACMGANYEFSKMLLDAGAEVNKPNAFNHTPLVIIINRLIEDGTFQNRCICFKIADVLINHGADLNWVIDKVKGYTLLHTLCASTMKFKKNESQLIHDIIKFLIDKGANILQRGLDDKLPEDLAATHCNAVAIIDLINKKKEKMPTGRQRVSSQITSRKRESSVLRNTFEERTELEMFQDRPLKKTSEASQSASDWKDKLGCISKKRK